jgi:HK97 family phage prohead protease
MRVKTDKVFNLITSFKAVEKADGSLGVRGMASTMDVDRAGDVIMPEAWNKGGLNNYKKNPILLFNHNYNKPIGKAEELVVTDNGLELSGSISKSASDNVWGLIKDGVLGAFSVGFLIKDADYMPETDGFRIKDAELFEVSVVSVPCNQTATFSLAKSFDSEKDYEDFKNTFTNREDLAGQSLAKEVNTSSNASDASEGARDSAQQEIIMSGDNTQTPAVDLEAVVKQAAEEAADRAAVAFAMKQAEQKAADKAEADEKAAAIAAEKEQREAIETAVQTGTERLVKDLEEKLASKENDMAETINQFKKELEDKQDEIANMRNSKRIFDDRLDQKSDKERIKAMGREFMYAHMLGVITGKGWDTDYAKEVAEKGGIDYTTNAPDLDQEIQDNIQKEITVHTKVADLFREVPVNGAATVLPFQGDVGLAEWKIADTTGNLENNPLDSAGAANEYRAGQITMNVYRLVSSTYMDNDTDEQVLVNLMPMLTEGVARAHARAVEAALLNGGGSVTGLNTFAAEGADIAAASAPGALTAADLLAGRALMGKFGLTPEDIVYIVNQDEYYSLLQDSAFQNLNEVGPMATKIKGMIGAVYGSPVLVSDEFPTVADAAAGAFIVNTRNYLIPRLRGVKVEQDYQVWEQRRVIVASQSLGFTEIQAGSSGVFEPSIKLTYSA